MKTFILMDKATSQVLHSTKTQGQMMSFIKKFSKGGLVFECNEMGMIIKLIASIDAIH